MIQRGLLCFLYAVTSLQALALRSDLMVKRSRKAEITDLIQTVGSLTFDTNLAPGVKERRRIACFFVFDREASADLDDDPDLAQSYATQLATLASRYAAHANIVVTNAGTEIWSTGDKFSFPGGTNPSIAMPDILDRFQTYLENTQKTAFGTKYAVGVLISNKTSIVSGGYSEGPPCTTSGSSVINYRQIPWTIAGLLAHELAHTLSVVHPSDLSYLCQVYPSVSFCASKPLPAECICNSTAFPPEQCLMTYSFGQAKNNAPKYTSCDIAMMNQFSSNIACLIN